MDIQVVLVLVWFIVAIITVGVIIGICGFSDDIIGGCLLIGIFWPLVLPIIIVALVTRGIIRLFEKG